MVRIKERYLLVSITYPPEPRKPAPDVPEIVALHRPTTDNMATRDLANGIKTKVAGLFGDYGSGAVENDLHIKYFSRATSTFIIRTSRNHYRMVWAALTFMDHLPVEGGSPCTFSVIRVSGTMRKAEEEAIRRARKLILAAKDSAAAKDSSSLSSIFGNHDDGDVMMMESEDSSDDQD